MCVCVCVRERERQFWALGSYKGVEQDMSGEVYACVDRSHQYPHKRYEALKHSVARCVV